MVYSARIVKGAAVGTARKLLKRAGTLYSASAALALAFYSLYIFTSLRLWVERSDAGVLDPVGEVLEILTLRRAFHGSDVLIMYTLMLAVAPRHRLPAPQGAHPRGAGGINRAVGASAVVSFRLFPHLVGGRQLLPAVRLATADGAGTHNGVPLQGDLHLAGGSAGG